MTKAATILPLAALLLFACSKPVLRSQTFYNEQQTAIAAMLVRYNTLYQQRPFNFGFTDGTHRFVSIEEKTPEMRYIFNTALHGFRLDTLLPRLGLDTVQLRLLAADMHLSGCLWLGRHEFYKNGRPYRVNYLSFGAAAQPSFFSERKYYVLGFPIDPWEETWKAKAFAKGGLTPLNDSVFFTISNRFK